MPENTTHCCCDESPVKPNCEITGDNIGERLQNIANCALTSTVEQNFYDAVVALYAQLVEFVESKLHFDLSKLYAILASLAIVCWLNKWIKFLKCVCEGLPDFFKDLVCLKLPSNCLLVDCDEEEEEEA